LADGLSRIYPPYVNAFTDRHLRYPDLKRENIQFPDEWYAGKILTTTDIMKAMYDQIIFIEKSSDAVKEKRLKALVHEISVLYDVLKKENQNIDGLRDLAQNKLTQLHNSPKMLVAEVSALTAVSARVLITPDFIAKKQNENEKISKILLMLRTLPVSQIPKKAMQKYRVLNDSILVTRKNKGLRFDEPGNLRIVCDASMALYILSIIHVMSGHLGQNTLKHLFSNTYKCLEGSVQGFVKLVCTGCRACRFHRPTHRKAIPQGRIPLPSEPNDTWMIDFMVFETNQTYQGKKVAAAFNIIDLFSNLLISCLCPDQTHKTVIRWFKFIFSFVHPPRKVVSDNAKQLCKHPAVLDFLKSSGVSVVTTTTPYHSSANKVERVHKLLREVLQLTQETFHRESQFEMYFKAVCAINSRPLTLALHPHVKEVLKPGENPVVTPFSLHYGNRPRRHFNIDLEDDLTPEERGVYRYRWQKIIKHYDQSLEKDLQERIKSFKGIGLNEGDLVLVQNIAGHKEQLKYYKNIYEIIKIEKARFYCAPLFPKGRILEVNGNKLKPYCYSELYDLLPKEVKNLMGENLSPDEIKDRVDGNEKPLDFTDWRFWRMSQPMALRKRLAPASAASIPALEVRGSEMSSEDESTSTIFTIPDKFPDFVSEATTLLDPSKLPHTIEGLPSLKLTKRGLEKVDNNLSWKRKKSSSIYLQSVSEKELETAHAKSIERKLKKERLKPLNKARKAASDPGAAKNIAVASGATKTQSENEFILRPKLSQPVDAIIKQQIDHKTNESPVPAQKAAKRAYSDENVRPYTPTKIIVVETETPKPTQSILKIRSPVANVEVQRDLPVQPVQKDEHEGPEGQQDVVQVEVASTNLGAVVPGPITRARAKQAVQLDAVPAKEQLPKAVADAVLPPPPPPAQENLNKPDLAPVVHAQLTEGNQKQKETQEPQKVVKDQALVEREANRASDDAIQPIPVVNVNQIEPQNRNEGQIAIPITPGETADTVPLALRRPKRKIVPPSRYSP